MDPSVYLGWAWASSILVRSTATFSDACMLERTTWVQVYNLNRGWHWADMHVLHNCHYILLPFLETSHEAIGRAGWAIAETRKGLPCFWDNRAKGSTIEKVKSKGQKYMCIPTMPTLPYQSLQAHIPTPDLCTAHALLAHAHPQCHAFTLLYVFMSFYSWNIRTTSWI